MPKMGFGRVICIRKNREHAKRALGAYMGILCAEQAV